MAALFLVGRILVGCYYLSGAFNHFANLHAMARYTAMHGVPAPEAAVLVAGLLLAVAGITLLLGAFPEVGVAALILFLVPVTLVMHAFWRDIDPGMRQVDIIQFGKNIGLLGSTLMFLGVRRPWAYSLERRLRLPVRAAA
jgi:putative oxidoreductase